MTCEHVDPMVKPKEIRWLTFLAVGFAGRAVALGRLRRMDKLMRKMVSTLVFVVQSVWPQNASPGLGDDGAVEGDLVAALQPAVIASPIKLYELTSQPWPMRANIVNHLDSWVLLIFKEI